MRRMMTKNSLNFHAKGFGGMFAGGYDLMYTHRCIARPFIPGMTVFFDRNCCAYCGTGIFAFIMVSDDKYEENNEKK